MDNISLKEDILKRIKQDADLYGKVATALNLSPQSLTRILLQKSPKLTQYMVLKVIADHLEVKDSTELLEIPVCSKTSNKTFA